MNEVALRPAPGEISVRNSDPPYETVVGVGAPLVGYLLEQLITERLENAQLNSDLVAAEAQRAEIEESAREKAAALAAWIAGLHDELAQHKAQLAGATAARASGARLLEEARAAEASARARRQLAVMKSKLQELGRQMATVQSVTEGLVQRLGAASAELKRRTAENERLSAELGALRMTTHSATGLAHLNGTPIEDQRNTSRERPGQPAELLSVTSVDLAPIMPHPKPRLGLSEVEAWTRASDTSDGGGAASGDVHVAIEDAGLVQAARRDVAVRDWEPMTDTTSPSAPESLNIPDTMPTAALALNPFLSRTLGAGEGGSTGLDKAAARIADGLRATREEAILQQHEQVFAVDVENRTFASSTAEYVPLDPALDISLLTAQSELIAESRGGIRFFPDGSSTGGRIELGLAGDRIAVNVRWSSGSVTLER